MSECDECKRREGEERVKEGGGGERDAYLCMIHFECKYSMERRSCSMRHLTSDSENGVRMLSKSPTYFVSGKIR